MDNSHLYFCSISNNRLEFYTNPMETYNTITGLTTIGLVIWITTGAIQQIRERYYNWADYLSWNISPDVFSEAAPMSWPSTPSHIYNTFATCKCTEFSSKVLVTLHSIWAPSIIPSWITMVASHLLTSLHLFLMIGDLFVFKLFKLCIESDTKEHYLYRLAVCPQLMDRGTVVKMWYTVFFHSVKLVLRCNSLIRL